MDLLDHRQQIGLMMYSSQLMIGNINDLDPRAGRMIISYSIEGEDTEDKSKELL